MENILKQKGMLCNIKCINMQIVMKQKKTVIHSGYFRTSSHLVSLFIVYNYIDGK